MNQLEKTVGSFNSGTEWTIEKVKELVSNKLKNFNAKEFLANVYDKQITDYDDIIIIHYDYHKPGIGSTYVFLNVTLEEEPKIEYGISSELNGDVSIDTFVPLGEESKLLSELYKVILKNSKEYPKLLEPVF